jgi:hypothetical protein
MRPQNTSVGALTHHLMTGRTIGQPSAQKANGAIQESKKQLDHKHSGDN